MQRKPDKDEQQLAGRRDCTNQQRQDVVTELLVFSRSCGGFAAADPHTPRSFSRTRLERVRDKFEVFFFCLDQLSTAQEDLNARQLHGILHLDLLNLSRTGGCIVRCRLAKQG